MNTYCIVDVQWEVTKPSTLLWLVRCRRSKFITLFTMAGMLKLCFVLLLDQVSNYVPVTHDHAVVDVFGVSVWFACRLRVWQKLLDFLVTVFA